MVSIKSVKDEYNDAYSSKERWGQSRNIKVISLLIGLALTAAILAGYFILRKKHTETVAGRNSSQSAHESAALPVKVQIFIDEPIRKGPQVTISGRVQNISGENLSNLEVELELEHKNDGRTEARTVDVQPKDLGPNQEGKYNLTLTGDYTNLKLQRIKSGPKSVEIGFKSAPGAKRPFEEPQQTTKTIIVNRPRSTKEGEEFINTPDNPSRIP